MLKEEEETQLPLHKRPDKEFLAIVLGGSLLALNAGMLNATTVRSDRELGSQPMTGTSTMIGISIADGDSALFGDRFGMLMFHILGACVSGYLVPHRTFYMGSDYGRLLKISFMILLGSFSVAKYAPDSVFWYYMVAFSGGVQNAMTSKYSGNILRTTHISGSVTDMGLIIGRRNFNLNHPMWKFCINLSIVSSFFIGALIGAFAVKSLHYNELLINIGLYGVIIVLYFILVKKEREYRCILKLLGLGLTAPEEHDTSRTDLRPIPEKLNKEDKLSDVEAGGGGGVGVSEDDNVSWSDDVDDGVDSDEDVDDDEPWDNQETEEDLQDEAKRGEEEGDFVVAVSTLGSSSSSSSDSNQIEMSDVLSLMSDDANHTEMIPTAAAAGADKEAPPPPVAVATLHPMKEMEHAWTFRVMMLVVCLLCFNAAFINATTKLSSKHKFTSHVTGATTVLAISISTGNWHEATVRAVLISLYALGAVVTGSVVKSDFYSLRAPYKRLFLFGTLLLTLGLVLHIYYPDEYYYYGCMAMFCGMQSALGCKVKSTILRTCYMTGTATDIGAAVGKLLRLGPTKAHVRSLQLLIPCILSFILGAFVAKMLFPVLGKYNTCVNIGIFVFLSILYWGFQHPRRVRRWLRVVGVSKEE